MTETVLPQFTQPIGNWRKRGAEQAFVFLATGQCVKEWPNNITEDQLGYHVWHYWSEGPEPELLWDNVREHVGKKLDLHIANNGEHPLYRLLLKNKIKATKKWLEEAKTPLDSITTENNTFWHAISWNGNNESLSLFAKNLSLKNINQQNNYGLTAINLSTHRMGTKHLKDWLITGADPNIPDKKGRNVLHNIALYGDVETFCLAQDMGCDSKSKDYKGQKPDNILKKQIKTIKEINTDILKTHWYNEYIKQLFF